MSRIMTLFTLMVALGLQSSAQAPAPQSTASPVEVVLADGTPVKLGLDSTAESKGARVGENLELRVSEDVRVGSVIVIPKGSIANAEVTNLRSGASSHAWMDINLESVTLADGHRVPIRASKNKLLRTDQATVVSSNGQDASITQGADLMAYINGNQTLDLTRLRAAGGPTTEVKVSSTPANAEITLDGRVAGTTPYTLHVVTGDHVLVLRMVGFQPWQGKVHVSGEPLTLDVPLVKQDGNETVPVSKPPQASLGDLARAARARKMQTANPPSDSAAQNSSQTPRDPMQPQSPKQ